MIKKATIIILLLLITFTSFSLDLRTLDGRNWFSWSYDRRIGYVQGALCEGFRITEMAILSYIVTDVKKLLSLRIDSETMDIEILNEISIFYYKTNMIDYPIYIVIYIRNSWKGQDYFPSWRESPWAIEKEGTDGI